MAAMEHIKHAVGKHPRAGQVRKRLFQAGIVSDFVEKFGEWHSSIHAADAISSTPFPVQFKCAPVLPMVTA